MRAAVLAALGGVPSAGEAPEPAAVPGRTLVSVRVGPLNPVDLAIASGAFYAHQPSLPYVPGVEGVGEVVASDSFAAGTRVWFESGPAGGALAELAAVDDESVVPLPAELELERAAIGNSGLAAWLALERAGLGAGDTVLVLGATGIVGAIATQLARRFGAGRVLAAGRDEERLARVARYADATVRLDADAGARRRALEQAAGGHGFDVIFDLLWGEPAMEAVALAAPGARWAQVGHGAGAVAELPAAALRSRSVRLEGLAVFSAPRERKRAAYAELAKALAGGEVEVPVRVAPLAEIEAAWARQAASVGTKQLLRI